VPTSLQTPITLPTTGYSSAATLGPFQNLEKIVFQITGGVVIFQVGRLDAAGRPTFDQTEAALPPGIWGFDKIYGIRFRSRDGGSLATVDPCTGYFDNDPDPYNPGTVPGSTSSITGAVNVQHNDALVGSQPTIDFEDSSGATFAWTVTNDSPGTRVKVTPPDVVTSAFGRNGAVAAVSGDYTAAQITNAADKASASAQVFTGEVNAPDFKASGLAGATSASRYVGATNSGSPASGTFVVGDYVVDRSGQLWICTTAGSPGTWTAVGASGNVVTSVFTRTGAVVATTGDYTAAQVTNAADKASASTQAFTGTVSTTSLFQVITTGAAIAYEASQSGDTGNRIVLNTTPALSFGNGAGAVDTTLSRSSAGIFQSNSGGFKAGGLTGATSASRYVGATTSGAPGSGTFVVGDFIVDQSGQIWVCTTAGSPGTWTAVGASGNVVTSVFTRTGAVVATTGDYTAAQVTNAADKASASAQIFTGVISTNPTGFSLPSSTVGAFLQTGTVGMNTSTATSNAVLISVANGTDTVARYVARPDREEWGPGTAARDTFWGRVVNTSVLGNTSGTETGLQGSATTGGFLLAQGSLISGAIDGGNVGSGTTLTPDFATGTEFSVTVNVAGATTLTVANPVNRPTTGSTAFLIIRLRNTAASGGTTITWGSAFAATLGVALPSTVNSGVSRAVIFFWDNLSSVWYPIISA
jgi:hypothetical protein